MGFTFPLRCAQQCLFGLAAKPRPAQTWPKFVLAVVFLLTQLPLPAQTAPQPTRGQMLYTTHCMVCHDTQKHWREKRAVRDWDGLLAQVRQWQGTLQLQWSDADIVEVATHLNDNIYRLPQRRVAGHGPFVRARVQTRLSLRVWPDGCKARVVHQWQTLSSPPCRQQDGSARCNEQRGYQPSRYRYFLPWQIDHSRHATTDKSDPEQHGESIHPQHKVAARQLGR